MVFRFGAPAVMAVMIGLVAAPCPAQALTQTIRCDGRFSYTVTFDDRRRGLTIEVEGMKRLLNMRQIKQEEDGGYLIWAFTPAFGGDRDMLIRFGREKWVRTYFRNGSDETVTCR
jgi:hypothetical protein